MPPKSKQSAKKGNKMIEEKSKQSLVKGNKMVEEPPKETEEEVLVIKEPDVEEVKVDDFTIELIATSDYTLPYNLNKQEILSGLDHQLMSLIVLSYKGDTDENEANYHGMGTAMFSGGHQYSGTWQKNMMHGAGFYTWTDGVTYEGNFSFNKISGNGRYTWPDGSKYEGTVLDGFRHGKGVYTGPNGSFSVYKGQWNSGLRHGEGILWYNEKKTSFYDGQWVEGLRSGAGRIVYASGNAYNGQWEDGKKNGNGIMLWTDKEESYEGSWLNDKQHGVGKHIWHEKSDSFSIKRLRCNQYQGDWKEGKRHGHGIFLYANGAKYIGQWDDNLKHGSGVFIYESGFVYEGIFEKDRMKANDSSSSRSDESIQAPRDGIRLDIKNLFSIHLEESFVEKEIRNIENTVLRWNTELRELYCQYSTLPCEGGDTTVFCMIMTKFWSFCHDARITGRNVPLAMINRILKQTRDRTARRHRLQSTTGDEISKRREITGFTSRPELDSSDGDWHDADRTVLYWEYVEALIRIASILYNDTDELTTLHEKFMHLIKAHINPHVTSLPVESRRTLVRHQWAQAPNKAIIDNVKEELKKIFQSYSDIHADVNDRTVTLRNLLRALRDGGILRSGFGVKKVLPLIEGVIFNKSNYDPMDPDNLDTDVIFDDFLDILLHVYLAQEASKPSSESNEATTSTNEAATEVVVVAAVEEGEETTSFPTSSTATGKDRIHEESDSAEEKSHTLDTNDSITTSSSDTGTDKNLEMNKQPQRLAVFLKSFLSQFTI